MGIVKDNNDLPVPDAIVLVENRDERTDTDENGMFELSIENVEENTIRIRLQVRKEGYGKKRPALDAVRGKINEITIIINPKP